MSDCEQCKNLREVIAAKDALIISLQQQLERMVYPMLPTPLPYLPPYNPPYLPGNRWSDQLGNPTENCPCRPENGGSGVCGCIYGGPQITCNV